MRAIKDILILSAALLCLLSCRKETAYPAVGSPLPDFAVRMDDGTVVRSADLRRGLSLVCFFHTLCPDCVRELDVLQDFYDRHCGDVRVVTVSRVEGEGDVALYWKEHGYTMPYSAQEDRSVYDLFSEAGIPYVVLARDGVIKGIWNDVDMFNETEFLKIVSQ